MSCVIYFKQGHVEIITKITMTDYNEEQRNEIEALESIYPEELKILSTDPHHSFELNLASSSTEEDAENATCVLQFTYIPKYPDEGPVMEITSFDNIEESHCDLLLSVMKEQVEENLGMAMVFTIYSAVQEKLNEIVDEIAEEKRNAVERKIKAQEEADRKKFEGTRVTVENFLAWKTKFDAEMEELKRQKGTLKSKKDPNKLTGKEMFLKDSALDDSDVKFLEEEGEKVEVDESLFQDMDDLDLDDELLDDLDEAAAS